jgi:Prokaryotic cytochrome b561
MEPDRKMAYGGGARQVAAPPLRRTATSSARSVVKPHPPQAASRAQQEKPAPRPKRTVGLALYSESNPGGFWNKLVGWIIPLCGGSFPLRMWHHTLTWGFVVFVVLHLYIVFYDDRQFKNGLVSSMVSGFKFYEKKDLDHDRWLS